MNLVPNWKRVLRRAWSVKFSLLATTLTGLAAALPAVMDMVPPTWFLLLCTLVPLAVDWLQTVTIARNPARWYERNPLLRWWMRRAVDRLQLPEVGVHVHFALSAVLIVGVACVIAWLWPRHLIGWAALWVAVEGWMVRGNYRLGIKPASL